MSNRQVLPQGRILWPLLFYQHIYHYLLTYLLYLGSFLFSGPKVVKIKRSTFYVVGLLLTCPNHLSLICGNISAMCTCTAAAANVFVVDFIIRVRVLPTHTTDRHLLSQKRHHKLRGLDWDDSRDVQGRPEETVDKNTECVKLHQQKYFEEGSLMTSSWNYKKFERCFSIDLIHIEKCGFGENLIKDLRRHLKFNRNLDKHSDGSRDICISISTFIGAPCQRLL